MALLKEAHSDPQAATHAATAIALSCGIASEHTALLKLSTAEQFAEHGLDCPSGHRAHEQWVALVKQREQTKAERAAAAAAAAGRKKSEVLDPLVTRYQKMI